jgi:hypothetical protein
MSPRLLIAEHSKLEGSKPSLVLSATLVKVYTRAKAGAAHTIHSVSAAKTPTVPHSVRCMMVSPLRTDRQSTVPPAAYVPPGGILESMTASRVE